MTADTSSFDPILKRVFADHLLSRLDGPSFVSPEWRAWAKEWLEAVPPTPEQERENEEWRARLPQARENLAAELASLQSNIEMIEAVYGVQISMGDGEYEIDDYDPPHRAQFRPKVGAPPAPPVWPAIDGKTITFRRLADTQQAQHE